MPKRILYECDKCGKIIEQDALPRIWVSAEIRQPFYAGDDEEFNRIWCAKCWIEINTKVSKKAKS